MALRDLIPWNNNRGRELSVRRGDEINPFFALHREMNRLFDDVFRGLDVTPFGNGRFFDHAIAWPSVEVSETDKEVKVTADLPGLEEKDIDVELANGVLAIRGEKKTESEDKDRLFSERYYGRFERRIALGDVDEEKATATFDRGVLTVVMPKSADARSRVRRIPINGSTRH